MHRKASATAIDATRAVKTIASTHTCADVITSSDATDVGAAKAADVTHTATDMRTTQTSNSAKAAADAAANVSTAAEAAAHATSVAATTPAASRLCLRSQKARRQQSSR